MYQQYFVYWGKLHIKTHRLYNKCTRWGNNSARKLTLVFSWRVWQVLRKVTWDKYVDVINVDDYRGQTVIFVVVRPYNFQSMDNKQCSMSWDCEVTVRCVDTSGIIDHQYLSFLFIVLISEVHMNMTITDYINLSLLSVLKLLCRQRCGFISLLISDTY